MVGSATFTIVTSIMSISVPMISTAAASQRSREPSAWSAGPAGPVRAVVVISVTPRTAFVTRTTFLTNTVLSLDPRSSQTAFETGTVFKVSTEPVTGTAEEEAAAADAGAAIPAPPWQRLPDRQTRRRRDPISREAIVQAAVRLLDTEGLDAFSMRRVADELGTGAASLYWHVGSKDGLLDLVMDQVIGEQRVPEPEPERWPEQITELA